jgi:hypothetical protein
MHGKHAYKNWRKKAEKDAHQRKPLICHSAALINTMHNFKHYCTSKSSLNQKTHLKSLNNTQILPPKQQPPLSSCNDGWNEFCYQVQLVLQIPQPPLQASKKYISLIHAKESLTEFSPKGCTKSPSNNAVKRRRKTLT